MPEYDFQSLSSFDFQLLSRDLLQMKFGVVLESFGPGRDKGVDFRLKDRSGHLVVQCKHYSDYELLLRVLTKHELAKVQRLRPTQYVLSLSTSLTPTRKDELAHLFAPYCQGTADIFGREDLNNLLGLYPEVERKNIKLWLTSTAVLEKFLNQAVWNDTALSLDRLKRRARLYVPNASRSRARKILDEHHYCIVAGIPGIGKTMLAEVLLIEHVNKHEYQAVRIANDLSEIKGVKDPKRRQIFYFDDFLGTTGLDKMQKNEDKRLIEFLDEVRSNDNWRFILTTREYILNAAKLRYESFAQPLVDMTPCIINLSDYTQAIRAKILYNHIYFSDVSDDHKRALLEGKKYERIIRHSNYNPRIVEYMTTGSRVHDVPATTYFEAFLNNLTNPMMVWDHAFRHQLSDAGQHLVLVMGTLGDEVRFCDLEAAFHCFYKFRQNKLGFPARGGDFENAVKELDGNFIATSLIGRDRVVRLHNPSLSDFLEHYFATTPTDLMDLIDSATFFDQFVNLWRGRRGRRYSAFENSGGDRFLQALGSGLMCPSCNFLRLKIGSGPGYDGVRVQQLSFEQRMSFVVEVVQVVQTNAAKRLQEDLIDQLKSQLVDNRGSKAHLVRLLKKLESTGLDKEVLGSLLQAAKTYLMGINEDSDLDDFEALADFLEAFPRFANDEELKNIRKTFLEFAQGYDDSWADSPDDYRYMADALDSVGGTLDADVTDVCEDLRSRASEWEGEIARSEERYNDEEDDEERWGRSDPGRDDTGEMFEELLEDLNEI